MGGESAKMMLGGGVQRSQARRGLRALPSLGIFYFELLATVGIQIRGVRLLYSALACGALVGREAGLR